MYVHNNDNHRNRKCHKSRDSSLSPVNFPLPAKFPTVHRARGCQGKNNAYATIVGLQQW